MGDEGWDCDRYQSVRRGDINENGHLLSQETTCAFLYSADKNPFLQISDWKVFANGTKASGHSSSFILCRPWLRSELATSRIGIRHLSSSLKDVPVDIGLNEASFQDLRNVFEICGLGRIDRCFAIIGFAADIRPRVQCQLLD